MAIAQVFQRYFKNIFILSVVSVLIACGGGGSSKKDTTPDAFSFTAVTGAALSTETTSAAITVAGINKEAAISITGGTYSINNGAFTAAAGTVSSGQTIKVKVTSSAATSTAVTATLTIGGVNGTFSVTTLADTTAPTAQIMFPPAVSMSDGATLKVRGTATDDHSNISSVTVNGVGAVSADNFATWTAEVSLSSGANTLTVVTTDSANNSNSDAAHVSVQRVADITNAHIPDANVLFSSPEGIVLDNNNSRVLVTDSALNSVIAVSLSSGERSIFSDASIPNASDPFIDPFSIVLDSNNNRALVSDYGSGMGIVALSLTNGARTIISSANVPDANNRFNDVSGIALDSTHNQILVLDDILHTLFKVDMSGVRTVFSDSVTPNANNLFSFPVGIALDSTNNRALVADSTLNAIVAVSLTDGARTIFSSASIPDATNPFSRPIGLTIDSVSSRVLVVDSVLASIVSVSLTNGTRTVLSSPATPNAFTLFDHPVGISIDTTHNFAYVLDQAFGAIFVMDLTTGERVIISK